MFKIAALGVLLLKGFLISGYFAFFHNRPKQLQIKHLEGKDNAKLAKQLNTYVKENPSRKLNKVVEDLNWLVENEYQRDIRVKRIIHQDLRGLVAMSTLTNQLSRPDQRSKVAYDQALGTISERIDKLRNTKDDCVREQILMLGEMIEDNKQ